MGKLTRLLFLIKDIHQLPILLTQIEKMIYSTDYYQLPKYLVLLLWSFKMSTSNILVRKKMMIFVTHSSSGATTRVLIPT